MRILAVWGSPSSGKTIMSVKLARYIASQKKNVILVLADMSAPPLPYVCPPSDLEAETSLGNILGTAHVDENLIKQNAILHKKNEYLTMLAMLKGETAFSYAPYTDTQARELLAELRRLADYIIIDCTSDITNDALSAVSLIESDAVLRLVSCNLKSMEDWIFRIDVAGVPERAEDFHKMKTETLTLPADEQYMQDIAEALGERNIDECVSMKFESMIPHINNDT